MLLHLCTRGVIIELKQQGAEERGDYDNAGDEEWAHVHGREGRSTALLRAG